MGSPIPLFMPIVSVALVLAGIVVVGLQVLLFLALWPVNKNWFRAVNAVIVQALWMGEWVI